MPATGYVSTESADRQLSFDYLLLIKLLHPVGQRRVVERSSGRLAVGNDVLNEVLERGPLGLVRTVLGDDEKGQRGDGIGVGGRCRWVHDRLPRVLRELRGEGVDGSSRALRGWRDVIAGLILDLRDGQLDSAQRRSVPRSRWLLETGEAGR